jgi:hypothetical protein
MSTPAEYFKHARSLGAFKASDCLALAREAAELDSLALAKKAPAPTVAWHEVNPDGTLARFSQGITVY